MYSIGPIIPYDTLQLFSSQAVHHLNTLTGACLPLFIKMHRIASLTKRCRGRREWNDDTLVDTVEEAETLENELKEEKKRMDAMVQREPAPSLSNCAAYNLSREARDGITPVPARGIPHRVPLIALHFRLQDTSISTSRSPSRPAISLAP